MYIFLLLSCDFNCCSLTSKQNLCEHKSLYKIESWMNQIANAEVVVLLMGHASRSSWQQNAPNRGAGKTACMSRRPCKHGPP